ncbi:MAG: PQQ-dependent sugar dehydrogenase [Verrucomicrobia bacterium]|nr:PQQ-dependent sugar dehydrogenase [Verrucomicrobiota bacterium]
MRPLLRPLPALLLAAVAASTASAQAVRTGTVAERYVLLCANCHGKNLEGAQAPTMLDDVWTNGGDDESLYKSIRTGFPDKGMPAWGAAIPEKEIRAMVIYIRELRAKAIREQTQFIKPADSVTAKTQLHDYKLDTWVDNLREPWSLAFLSSTQAIMTEKLGFLYLIEKGKIADRPIAGVPTPDIGGQAGYFDIVPHPDYAKNNWLYLSYADLRENPDGTKVSLTRIIRGKLKNNQLTEQQTIFQGKPEHYIKAGGVHFGGRIAFDDQGYIFFTIGERGQDLMAQDTGRPNGKVHRLHDDGRVPADNPFVNDPKAVPSIWSYGHRNPQGLARNATTGELYDVEHGPRGGDEVNFIRKGLNYGWPIITYGMDYSGVAYPRAEGTEKAMMEQPVTYWVPSIAPCGANFYTGDLFPKWKNNLFVASLAAEELRRLELKDGKLVTQEIIFKSLGRIRHVITGPDGALYVLLPKRIARIVPAAP